MKKSPPNDIDADSDVDDDNTHDSSSDDPRLLAAALASLAILIGLVVLWPRTSFEPDPNMSSSLAPTLGAAEPAWVSVATSDGSQATPRHEAGGVVVDGELYLLGGRRTPPVERYSPGTNGWRDLGAAPLELHHFQPVAIDGRIIVIGAFTCCYPDEPSVREIHAFDTRTETWDIAGAMPADRARGSAAAVVRDGLVYVIGGNTRGHDGGAVPWFDVWNPVTDEWKTLPDAPHARDHFQAALVGEQLVAAGGRRSKLPNPSADPVLPTDVYDFASGRWRTADAIPTPRAGTVTVSFGDEAIVLGGELNTEASAIDAVEAFDVTRDTWRPLPSMIDGRHGSGAGIIDRTLHIVAGATSRGGSGETSSHETLALDGDGNPSEREDEPEDSTVDTGPDDGTGDGTGEDTDGGTDDRPEGEGGSSETDVDDGGNPEDGGDGGDDDGSDDGSDDDSDDGVSDGGDGSGDDDSADNSADNGGDGESEGDDVGDRGPFAETDDGASDVPSDGTGDGDGDGGSGAGDTASGGSESAGGATMPDGGDDDTDAAPNGNAGGTGTPAPRKSSGGGSISGWSLLFGLPSVLMLRRRREDGPHRVR